MPNGIEIHQVIANALSNMAGEQEFNELALCIVKGGTVEECLKKIYNPFNPPKPVDIKYISHTKDLMIKCLKTMKDDTLKKLKIIENTLGRLEKTRK